jgi:predicted nucleotidyltransferase
MSTVTQALPSTISGELAMVLARLQFDPERVTEFCRRHDIIRLAFYGSVLRDDFKPESDLDVLVEFRPGKTPGLRFFTIQDSLSQLLRRRVDLNTPQSLSVYFRDRVEAEAVPLYVES